MLLLHFVLLFLSGDLKNKQTSNYRYLGVDVDSCLSFSSHTQRVATSTKRAIGELSRTLRKWAPKEVFNEAVTKIALPVFLYAIKVWFPPTVKDQQRLERVMKFAARKPLNNYLS